MADEKTILPEEEVKAKESQVIPEIPEEKTDDASAGAQQVVIENDFKSVIKNLLADPKNRVYRNVEIKTVTKRNSEDVDWTNLTLVIRGRIPGYVPVAPGSKEYKYDLTSNVYVTSYTLAAVLKQNPRTAMLADKIIENPAIAPIILCGATVNIIQTDVAKNEIYYNPFSNADNKKPYTRDHDWIVSHIYDIKLGENGNQVVDRTIDFVVAGMFNK